jgi:hypothetical protein
MRVGGVTTRDDGVPCLTWFLVGKQATKRRPSDPESCNGCGEALVAELRATPVVYDFVNG